MTRSLTWWKGGPLHRVWRWLRFPFAIIAAAVVGMLVWLIWLLSGQRYQDVLTSQLSAALGADVQVAGSELSLRNGLGIQLHAVRTWYEITSTTEGVLR